VGFSQILTAVQVDWGFWARPIYLACKRQCLAGGVLQEMSVFLMDAALLWGSCS